MAPETRPTSLRAALRPHPGANDSPVERFSVHLQRQQDGVLRVRYEIKASVSRLRVPPVGPRKIGHDLWRRTCFELFLSAGLPAYCEYNFSPSREWAAYAFDDYRRGYQLLDEPLAPDIDVRLASDGLHLDARLPADAPPRASAGVSLLAAATAVVEDSTGRLSYWAVHHPCPKPDFHHADGFVLVLEAAP